MRIDPNSEIASKPIAPQVFEDAKAHAIETSPDVINSIIQSWPSSDDMPNIVGPGPSPDSQTYDETLNDVAVDMAEGVARGMDKGERTVAPLTGEAGEQFRQLVAYHLNEQREQGEAPDLAAAIEDAKTDLFTRIGNALTDRGYDDDAGLDIFQGYWDRHGGRDAARSEG